MSPTPWKVLVVDDDEGIHSITRMVFRGYEFENRPITLINASSSIQAKQILAEQPDIAVTLLDVVMETDNAGLHLVDHIRKELKNRDIRIILRTGHPGFAPETKVIIDYDINDYLSKVELSASRLLTSVVVALRSYADILNAKPSLNNNFANQNNVTETTAKQSLLDGYSRHIELKIQPLLAAIKKLQHFSHKPLVDDLIDEIHNHCSHLSKTNQLLQPIHTNNISNTDISDAINQLIHNYLAQTRQHNWIIDYEISSQLSRKINLDLPWFNALLMTLFEISICRSNTQQATELFINIEPSNTDLSIMSISVTGKLKTVNTMTPWQEILLNKLSELSKFYGGTIQELPSQIKSAVENTVESSGQILISYSFNLPAD